MLSFDGPPFTILHSFASLQQFNQPSTLTENCYAGNNGLEWTVTLDQFIASFERAPKKLILDFDATDGPVHGGQ